MGKGIIFNYLHLVVIVISILGSFQPSWAADEGYKSRRRTTINFEDELIEGEVKKPELFYLLQQKQFNFKRLIKLRENFLPEMRRTAEDVQRSGSGD